MASIGFTGLQAAMRKLEKHKLLIHGQIADTKRRIVKHVLTDLVTNSPQWSGNLASQWYVEHASSPKGSYKPLPEYMTPYAWEPLYDPHQMGDNPAVANTLARELPKVASIKWNSSVKIVNYAPYAEDVENNIGPEGMDGTQHEIRPENLLPSYGAVAMVGYASMKYNNLRYLRGLAE